MALVQRNLFNVRAVISQAVRSLSSPSQEKDIKKSVFISQSTDVFTNLALENWLYKNFDFTNHHVLFMWKNQPCVVIGKDQNPWQEANMCELDSITKNGVKLARRITDGDAVYHDEGNLNMTFFTSQNNYNKRYNFDIISRALFRQFKLKLQNPQNNYLTLRNCKVSEAEIQLGQPNIYHHCSLLVNVNKVDMNLALQGDHENIKTEIKKSVKAKVMNLCEEVPRLNTAVLYKAIGWEFLRTKALSLFDGGMELANQQKGFHLINPTEQWFPGLSEIRNEFTSWHWLYGQTPKFTISRTFTVPDSLQHYCNDSREGQVTMVVDDGQIIDVNLYLPTGLINNGFSGNIDIITNLKGCKFSENAFTSLELSVEGLVNDKERFVTDCVRQVMFSV